MQDDAPQTLEKTGEQPKVNYSVSPGLPGWFAAQRVNIAVTSYQSGRFYLLGRNPQTGDTIKIKASKKVAFRVAKELKETV